MLGPLLNIGNGLLDQLVALAPMIIGIAVFIAGVGLAFGNHQKGKEGVALALLGGAIMLGAKTIAAGVHA